MTHERIAFAGVVVLAMLGFGMTLSLVSQRDEARQQRDYAISRRTEAERQVEYYRQLANTWEKLSGANESLVRANALRTVSCERLMKVEVER